MNVLRNMLIAFRENIKQFLHANFVRPHEMELTQSGRARLAFIDLAKGFCIFLVVVQHADLIPGNILGARCLRMPLYFILAGLFFRDGGSIFRFLVKKLNRLVIPFFFFLTLGGLAHWSLNYNTPTEYPFYRVYTDVIWHPSDYIYPNGVLWFLEALFVTNILFWLTDRIFRKSILILGAGVAFGALGVSIGRAEIALPFYIHSALMAFPFFTIGALTARTELLYKYEEKRNLDLLVGLSLLGISCSLAVITGAGVVVYSAYITSPVLLTYLLSIGMVFGFLFLCRRIVWLPVISYIGRYSLIVLGLHFVILETFEELFPELGPHGTLVPFLVSLLGSWIAIPFMKALFPRFTAQADLIPDSFARKYFRRARRAA